MCREQIDGQADLKRLQRGDPAVERGSRVAAESPGKVRRFDLRRSEAVA